MNKDLKFQISGAIQKFSGENLLESSLQLFAALNYPTLIKSPMDDPSWQGFRNNFLQNRSLNEKAALTDDWKYFDILFQLTDEAMRGQMDIFSGGRMNDSIMNSFLFLVMELKREHYTKTELSQITREVNKIFAMPAIILFKTGNFLTLAVIHRRLHKKDESKDVLEKVTLIKDIDIACPHRAHIEILFDLSFDELKRKHGFANFVELHQAWQKTLDIKELNKRFFKELFNWYHWAVRNVRFPNKVSDDKDDMLFNQEAVIRLLTRLIFIWFIKEKNLVPDRLFDPRFLNSVLKNFNPSSESNAEYYRAILQNLFFATLNTPMDRDITDANRDEKRGFIEAGMKGGRANPHYTDQTRYRYKDYFIHEQKALELFATIPFLNGGLFECLDYAPEEGQEEIRIDGFSTKKEKQAFVPNMLFFGEEFTYDLNDEYGTKGKQYKVKGLIHIFNGYKFTITENTPLEEEVALDPELLGKVFENLLATYNPETKTTARKQTGSFYTPREIVNYMVDESLIAYLSNSLPSEDRIRRLFSADYTGHDFSEEESSNLIRALSHCRILDPACGSGAFPMGILHRMVDLLKKLDPENESWKEIQKERAIRETREAYDIGDVEERHQLLEEINKAFDDSINNPDYARKLFLIENCIYGVDIQQIAVQIAKLRFFISLVAEQKVDDSKPNRNILSMPNLETKFVAANTLIALEKPEGQLSLMSMDPAIEAKEKELRRIREKIFFTRRYQDKKKLKQEEKKCREELKKILLDNNMSKSAAEQMASWNPFDPLRSSPYFDIETMFGFEGGFDVVIGNPPYIEFKKLPPCEKSKFLNFITAKGKYDIYVIFDERSILLLRERGIVCFVQPTTFLKKDFGQSLRRFIKSNTIIKKIHDFADIQVFDGATNYTGIFIFEKGLPNKDYIFPYHQYLDTGRLINEDEFNSSLFVNSSTSLKSVINIYYHDLEDEWNFQSEKTNLLIDSISYNTKYLREITSEIFQGIASGKDEVFYINESNIRKYNIENALVKKLIKGKDIKKYFINWSGYFVIYPYDKFSKVIPENQIRTYFPNTYNYLLNCRGLLADREYFNSSSKLWYELWNQRNAENFATKRIVCPEISDGNNFAVVHDFFGNTKTYHIIPTERDEINYYFLLGLLNSNLLDFTYKKIATPQAGGFYAYKSQFLMKLPIIITIQKKEIAFITKIIEILTYQGINPDFFNNMLNSLVYELYFPSEIQSAGCEILKHLHHLPELKDDWDDAKKLSVIEAVYKELSDPSHPVSIAMEKMKEVEEVRVIEEGVGRKLRVKS